MSMTPHPWLATILAFVQEIGIATEFGPVPDDAFLPGLEIRGNLLRIAPEHLLSPGDILHEAGHIALTPPNLRADQSGDVGSDPGIEMAVIAWTYAAAVHLKIPPEVVFHADGYRGGSENLLDNFRAGYYIGVPILQWLGMTLEPGPARAAGVPPYPHMMSWMRA